ncbi:MAG: hypothetical protein NVS9B12_06560 [Vulcanimicrobiaceae bacterium]
MKLVIGVPTAGNPAEPFVASLRNLRLPEAVNALENKTATGNFVPAQRELLAEFAVQAGADYLVMVDDDMIVPPDAIGQLLEPFADRNVGIVGALCYSRDGLRPMAVVDWDAADTTGAAIPAFDDRTPTQVDGIGFGLAMVRVEALARLDRPLFPAHIYIERALARVRICNEDFLFCKRLREAGWKVMLHPAVRCGHYDRASGKSYPLEWETPQETNHRRMVAGKTDGTVGKVPFDSSVPRAAESHLRADVEYILAD